MRKPWRWALGGSALIIAAAGIVLLPVRAVDAQPEPARPKLVVLVVFDQMRGDYLKKWQPLVGDGGFKRMQSDGAWFTNCHYPYAYTLTAAGHTSIVTGTSPYKHGIIANEWYDRANGENVASTTPPPEEIKNGAGPYRRKSETVGDVLLRVLMGRGKMASLSIKERSAVLMAALRASLCYWLDPLTGNFETSPFYRLDPHPWVTKFNKGRPADKWLGKTWDRFDPKLDYAKHSGPDDFITEGTGYLQGRTFPHPFQLGKTKDDIKNAMNYYDAVANSPMGNELLLSFAKAAIVNEKLGQGAATDLLCISFSSNDLIGHTWGPDSQEVLDVTLRSDALIKDLLGTLDDKVGKGNYYLAVTADHGVCPLPEFAKQQGKTAGRIEPELLTTLAEEFLNKKYLKPGEKAPWIEFPRRGNPWVYFNYETLKELKLTRTEVETALAKWYNEQPGIEWAFTRTQMMDPKNEEAKELPKFFTNVKRSFHPDCSGDVMVILKPYYTFSPPTLSENPEKWSTYRAAHGTPHAYDTHVPLLVLGPRIKAGERDQRVVPQIMASILSEALALPRPKDSEYPAPRDCSSRGQGLGVRGQGQSAQKQFSLRPCDNAIQYIPMRTGAGCPPNP
ncbi:MAG: alkaline phosphatase family protein [Planctomycetes bacterium]|nr:alkaline phosphatase family protein [Planctomycetota bacterium]